MELSTGLPRQKGIAGATRVIRARTSSTTVKRPTESKGSLDETTTTLSEHVEDLWLFSPQESIAQEIVGEHPNGSLGALAVSDGTVDIQHNDRITHGGVVYEVDTVVGHPEDGDADGTRSEGTDFWMIDLVRRS